METVEADMGVVVATGGVVEGVGEARTDEADSESGVLRGVAVEEEEEEEETEEEDMLGGVCRGGMLVGVGCWVMVVVGG